MENINQTNSTNEAKRLWGVNIWRYPATIVEYMVVKETPKTYTVVRCDGGQQRTEHVVRKSTMEVYNLRFCESHDAAVAYVKQLYEEKIERNNIRIESMQKENEALAALLKNLPTIGGDA